MDLYSQPHGSMLQDYQSSRQPCVKNGGIGRECAPNLVNCVCACFRWSITRYVRPQCPIRRPSPGRRKRRCKAQYGSHWDDSGPGSWVADRVGQELLRCQKYPDQTDHFHIILLDGLLEQYGPDAHNLRVMLRDAVPPMVDRIWNEGDNGKSAPFAATAEAQAFVNKVQELKPNSEAKRALQARVLNAVADLAQSRLSLFAQAHNSIPVPFLAILIFWLTIIFASFGLFVGPIQS